MTRVTIPKKARDNLKQWERTELQTWGPAESLKDALRLVRDAGFLTDNKARAFIRYVEIKQNEAEEWKEWKLTHGQ